MTLGIGLALCTSVTLGNTPANSASVITGARLIATAQTSKEVQSQSHSLPLVEIGHRKKRASGGRKARKRQYRRHHKKFHKRYRPRQRNYGRAHRNFHKHYRRKHNGPTFYFGFSDGYYDPFYYDPWYRDPYYYGPPYRSRLTCARVRRIVRRHGYRRIRAIDCKGKVYAFIAWKSGRRYKIKASAYNGRILSKRRY